MKNLITVTLAALGLLAAMSPLSAADADANATAITVWVDGKGQSSMADKANKKHAEMAAKGWRFEGLDVYTEDGDMKGLFVTYVRDPAPTATP
jgi:maltose-binding protein MalE